MDDTNRIKFQKAAAKGVLYGFIPKELALHERPELNVFPFNVMFAKYKVENGKTIMGSAVYEPSLTSFKTSKSICCMKYFNKYDLRSWLLIEYDKKKKTYKGEKFVLGKSVGCESGTEWNDFFASFTALGLSNGERCMFDEITP